MKAAAFVVLKIVLTLLTPTTMIASVMMKTLPLHNKRCWKSIVVMTKMMKAVVVVVVIFLM